MGWQTGALPPVADCASWALRLTRIARLGQRAGTGFQPGLGLPQGERRRGRDARPSPLAKPVIRVTRSAPFRRRF